MTKNFPKDRTGKVVEVGDIVKIISLDDDFISSFSVEERLLISSMIGRFFKVVAYDELGQPCVLREWHDENGQPQSYVIALDQNDMEKC